MTSLRRAGAGLALLLLTATACGSGDKPTQVATAPTTTAPTAPPTTAAPTSKVVLDSAGAQPRSVLTLHMAAGSTARTAIVTKTSLGLTVNGKATPAGAVPATKTVVEERVDRVDGDGTAHLSISIVDIATVPTAGTDPTVVKGADTALGALKGLKGTSTVDVHGTVSNVTFGTQPITDPSIKTALDSLVSQVGVLAAPFPADAVGVGARWTATSTANIAGLQMTTTTHYTLRSHSGNGYELDATGDATASTGNMSFPNLPGGAQVSVGNLTLHTTGQLAGDLTRPLPTNSSSTGTGDGSVSMTVGTNATTLAGHLTIDLAMSPA